MLASDFFQVDSHKESPVALKESEKMKAEIKQALDNKKSKRFIQASTGQHEPSIGQYCKGIVCLPGHKS